MALRLLEHYVSVQGEGPWSGAPTQFVRFAGCNLSCPGWPCDTPYSIKPDLYRAEQQLIPVRAPSGGGKGLIGEIVDMYTETGAKNVCLTGGEPLLQRKKELDDLIESLHDNWGMLIEMFSNGTIPYTDKIIDLCEIRMDWKLPGSGEDPKNPVRLENFYRMRESDRHTIKFTMKSIDDFYIALGLYERYIANYWDGTIYAGPVWDSPFEARHIVGLILHHRLPWRLNVQLHKVVWPADARRT